ncbi:amidohydrolase family protein [Terrimonas pollutisoli]|uniref:amidohydrolase family protein n=1 Tax=Terrimonas pollutisoli TaxID=3034147 RepID=UPI0023EB32AD|nr:amidohydrolase family protein [Terrimonas sp. H1YJ31]
MKIIDTHVHVWNLNKADYPWLKGDRSILNRTWAIDELEEERKQAGITAGVLVQASGNVEDTDFMLQTAYETEWIKGVVCWLPLTDTTATQRLLEERYLKEKYCKGIRHQVHDEKDSRWLLQPSVIESLKLLAEYDIPYDIVGILPAHIETVLELTEKLPGLRMVFDHLNWPPIPSKEKFGKWGELMSVAARHKNLYAKISGLGTASGQFANRTKEDIKPYVDFVLQHFGIERCFCGGDWPVSNLANSYTETWQVTKDILDELLTEKEQNKVLFDNANKFYQLGLS